MQYLIDNALNFNVSIVGTTTLIITSVDCR